MIDPTRFGVESRFLRLGGGRYEASDELIVQLVVARHARQRLSQEAIRDIKLVSFLIDLETGLANGAERDGAGFPYDERSVERISALSGLSRERTSTAVMRLVEAGALVSLQHGEGTLIFADRVLRPAGAVEFIDWATVLPALAGHLPGLLVFRAALGSMKAPWNWVPLSYENLAAESCYSLGMARHGVMQLVGTGVLERRLRSGRPHDYRCSDWAMGQGANAARVREASDETPVAEETSQASSVRTETTVPVSTVPMPKSVQAVTGAQPGGDSEITVAIGDLVLTLPAGTEIRMRLESDGSPMYEIGPHLKLKQRPG